MRVPRGSKLIARCQTAAGRTCKGILGRSLTRDQVGGTLRIKALERRYPAGTQLVVTITNPAYITQVKTLTIRKRRGPAVGTRCQAPDTSRLTRC